VPGSVCVSGCLDIQNCVRHNRIRTWLTLKIIPVVFFSGREMPVVIDELVMAKEGHARKDKQGTNKGR
jgi:hypothetical protein